MKHSFLDTLLSTNTYVNHSSQMTPIIDNVLFLGAQHTSTDDMLSQNNIKRIISIGCVPLTNKYVTYKFDIDDNGGSTTQLFNDIIPKIHAIINECVKNNEPLLVHCQAGISRSAISIITWLMKYKQMSYDEAYQFVKKRRPIIAPNIYFVDYAKHNFML